MVFTLEIGNGNPLSKAIKASNRHRFPKKKRGEVTIFSS
jgi:hypothetical protein